MQIILFIIILLPFWEFAEALSAAECSFLADLWTSTNGSAWKTKWPSQPPTSNCNAVCSGWYGITCSGGSIVQM